VREGRREGEKERERERERETIRVNVEEGRYTVTVGIIAAFHRIKQPITCVCVCL